MYAMHMSDKVSKFDSFSINSTIIRLQKTSLALIRFYTHYAGKCRNNSTLQRVIQNHNNTLTLQIMIKTCV